MDEDNPQPTVQILKKGFFETKRGKAVLILCTSIILFVILIVGLNYFYVILPISFLPQKLLISCPIKGIDCNNNIPIRFNNKPATGYKLASQSAVVNPIKVVDSKQFILPPFTKEDPIGINQSFIIGNTCYTITYTVPYDANIATVNILPLNTGAQIITLGSGSIKVEDQDLNLILQLQKRPLEDGQIDQQKCPVYNIDPTKFGEHQQITPDLFKNELE